MSREPSLSRRGFLTAAAGVGAAAVAGAAPSLARVPRGARLPDPARSGLDHIVVVCMENRSFDHYFGWLDGADGRQAGLRYQDDQGHWHATHHLQDRSGCGFNDPDHSYAGGRVQYDHGKLDGFRRGGNDDFALGYYTEADLPLYGPLLREATTFDRYFCSILGPTYPNRFYTHAAATDRIDNATALSTLPTIWDRLAAAGVPRRYYFSDLPFLGLWGPKYVDIASPIARFFVDAAAGMLPAYSYLDPFFLGEDQGGSNDDHPHADIRRGQAFVSQVVRAITQSPQWERTALVITYDEWGGFFEHVRPPVLPDLEPAHAQAGFRVPCMVLSPFARRRHVDHAVYDHASILKMVEWRWGLAPLTPRDRAARNLAESLDFAHPRRSAPALPVVADPGPHICGTPTAPGPVAGGRPMGLEDPFWRALADSPLLAGWDHLR